MRWYLLDEDKNLLHKNEGAACYAGITRYLTKKVAYVKSRGGLENIGINYSVEEFKDLISAINQIFPDNPLPEQELAEELRTHSTYTISADRCGFDAFAICTIFRYLWEYPGVIRGYFALRKQYPRMKKWKALILGHSREFSRYLSSAHGLFSGGQWIKITGNIKKVVKTGREKCKNLKVTDGNFGFQTLNDSFETILFFLDQNDGRRWDQGFDKEIVKRVYGRSINRKAKPVQS